MNCELIITREYLIDNHGHVAIGFEMVQNVICRVDSFKYHEIDAVVTEAEVYEGIQDSLNLLFNDPPVCN